MKNLTQLPGSGKGSKAKNDNTLGLMHGGIRSRIGSMSVKNTSLFGVILALLLTLGVGEMKATTYTVAGTNTTVLGTEWDPSNTANDMTQVDGAYYLYKSQKNSTTTISYKVCKDHGWSSSYPGQNQSVSLASGAKDVIFYFNGNESNPTVQGAQVTKWTVVGDNTTLFGTAWSPSATTNNMTYSSSKYTKTYSNVSLTCGTIVEWKLACNGGWNCAFPGSNKSFTINATGTYNITFEFNPSTLTVTATVTPTANHYYLKGNSPLSWDDCAGTELTASTDYAGNTYYYYQADGSRTFKITEDYDNFTTERNFSHVDNHVMRTDIDLTGSGTGNVTLPSAGYIIYYPASDKICAVSSTNLSILGKPYTITYKDQGGGAFSGTQTSPPTTHTYGTATTLKIPTKTGYDFGGWFTVSDCGSGAVGNTSSASLAADGYDDDITLYAKWTEKTYSVTVATANSTMGKVMSNQTSTTVTAKHFTSDCAITATAADGYRFTGWTKSGSVTIADVSAASTTIKATATGATVTANFEALPSGQLDIVAGANGQVKKQGGSWGSSASYTDQNDDVDLNIYAQANAGYHFVNWTKSGDGSIKTNAASGVYTLPGRGSATVTANFAETTTTLTPTVSYDHGTSTYTASASSSGTIGVETTTTLTCSSPNTAHYTFAGWTLTNLTVTAGSASTTSVTVKITDPSKAISAVAKYEEVLSTTWTMKGTFVDNYETAFDFVKNSGESTGSIAYCNMSLTGGTTYYFQVIEGGSNWKGNTGTMTRANCTDWPFEAGYQNNCGITADFSGTYIFKIDYSGTNPKVSVTYPDVNAVVGSFNEWDAATDPLDFDGNVGTAVISIDGSDTDYEFKIVDHNSWRGYETEGKQITDTESDIDIYTGGDGNNIALTADIYPSGDYTFSYNKSTHKLSVTYPTPSYVVSYGVGTVKGQSDEITTSPSFPSGKKVLSGTSVTFTAAAAASGYTWRGWYTTATADPSNWATNRITTDLAYTTTISAAKTIYAVYTANTYTVSFNVNGGTASTPDSKSVTFGSAYGELPGGMTHASKIFKGWYTESSGGTLVTAETLVSTAGNHTLYAQYEDIYSVNIDYKCGDVKLRNSSSTSASPTALTPTIIAPEILGYEFSNWSGSNVTPADASNDTTTITATAATTITANYTAIPTVYFKNNLGWEHVYVTFDCNWVTAGGKSVPNNNTKPYYEMTQLGTSDIFSCRIPDAYVTSNYEGWKNNIAFDNNGFAATDNVGTNTAFNSGEFLGRGDFDPSATMFIPYDGDSETRNGGTYYRTGCWMKYNSTDPGYKLYANTYKTGSGGSAVTGTPVLLTADIAGGFEFKAKVNFGTANYTYGFMLHKEYTKNSDAIWYTNTSDIYASTTTLPWDFTTDGASENGTRCGIHTEATGDYEFTVSFGTGKPMVNVTYPASVGDWRLAYNDRVAWSGSAHAADWYIYSRVIKAEANAEDIVSFYVSKASGANAHVELQKCTAINASTGAETWTKQGSNLDISSITGTGIYNFKVTQNGSKVASAAYDGSYNGNFYIRTDASDGGWSNYKTSGTNTMTYSEYAEDNSGFTHYFMRYTTKGSNIKFCIANDYSPCLTEYCVSDTFTNEWIEANGNVRFMWDVRTNAVSRAYISGSSVVADRFLVLEGDSKMFDENGNALAISGLNANEMEFTDDQNWIYEATVKAQPGARIKLTAKYNNKIQYFYGKAGARSTETTDLLLGGSGPDKYKVRIVYDFKTNRLMKAFMPDGDINSDLEINADLMIVREAQGDAQQITFGANGALSQVKTVYGAMKFNKYNVNNKSKESGHAGLGWSQYKRDLFYISFPFDVKLSDVFGFGSYGTHWIIEYYDGKGRAANGYWQDSDPNWKFVMPSQRSSFTLKANEGYILALDLDEMTESASIWNNGVEDVYIYFPSDGYVSDIEAVNKLVEIDQTGYECTIKPRFPGGDDRRLKDSYWHCIGVPSFANYSRDLTDTNGGTTIDWRSTSMPYLYEWDSSNNSLSVTTSSNFTFKAMYSYLVQYAGESIYWSQVNATPSSVVARQKDVPRDIEFRMELQQGAEKADQAFVRLSDDERVTTGYDFNYDLSKEFKKGTANIYTVISSVIDNELSLTEAAANVLPMSEQTTVVPVGVKIAANSDYTFSIPDGTEGVGVTLIDTETGIRTVLSAVDYTVSLEAGTYDNRFVLEISPIHNVPTEIEQSGIDSQQSDVRKLLIDGLLYIVRDNKMYDARGARVE